MTTKGGFRMETVIIVGAVWFSLLFIFLWLNYRFHRFFAIKKHDFILESPAATESSDIWQGELDFSGDTRIILNQVR
jgi:hypothetical protein